MHCNATAYILRNKFTIICKAMIWRVLCNASAYVICCLFSELKKEFDLWFIAMQHLWDFFVSSMHKGKCSFFYVLSVQRTTDDLVHSSQHHGLFGPFIATPRVTYILFNARGMLVLVLNAHVILISSVHKHNKLTIVCNAMKRLHLT